MNSTGRLGFTITAKITVSHDDSDNHYLLLMLRQKNSQFFQTPQKVITTATSGFAIITIKYKHYCNYNQYQQVPHLHPQQYYYQNLPCLQRQHHDDSLTRSQKHRDGCSPNLNQIPNTVKVGEDLWIIWCYESSG